MRVHQNLPFFMEKNGPKWPFFGQKLGLLASDKQLKTSPPILGVLDAKKQVIEAFRSRKHNLQHAYAPKFAIFHGKNGQKWPFFGQKLSFFGFRQAFEGPPPLILRVLDAK